VVVMTAVPPSAAMASTVEVTHGDFFLSSHRRVPPPAAVAEAVGPEGSAAPDLPCCGRTRPVEPWATRRLGSFHSSSIRQTRPREAPERSQGGSHLL
jgi:hypothetical protein